jgi:hypothetical protein
MFYRQDNSFTFMKMFGVGFGKGAFLPLLFVLFPTALNAFQFTLAQGNSVGCVDASGPGMENWRIDGEDHLYKQWFWYRIGSTGPENNIATLPLIGWSQPGAGKLDLKFGNSQLSVQLTYSLMGGCAGSGQSDIGEQVRIDNLSGAPLPLHFFQYTDFDLGRGSPNQTVQLGSNLQGLFDEAYQGRGRARATDTVVTPGANHGEVAIGNTIFNELTDANPTTLNDVAGPIIGDCAWAFEWDPIIGVGGSFIFSIEKNVTIISLPEPGVVALLPAGVFAVYLRRRLIAS